MQGAVRRLLPLANIARSKKTVPTETLGERQLTPIKGKHFKLRLESEQILRLSIHSTSATDPTRLPRILAEPECGYRGAERDPD